MGKVEGRVRAASKDQFRYFCPLCDHWTSLGSAGLCLDCELEAAIYRVNRQQFEAGLGDTHTP